MALLMILVAMLLSADHPKENPWCEKAAKTVAAFEQEQTAESLAAAFDAVWRADDWETGLRLAERTRQRWLQDPVLEFLAMRALWRSGEIDAAERIAVNADSMPVPQPVLSTLLQIAGARGDDKLSERIRATLERLGPKSAVDYYALAGDRLLDGPPKEVAKLVDAAAKALSAENGYPDTVLSDSLDGFAEFYSRIDDGRLNVVESTGQAAMPVLRIAGLPYCDVMVNGEGPFRMIVDTGGSILLSLSPEAAEQAGLKVLARASVRGAGGKESSWRTLSDRVDVGDIRIRRAMTDVYEMPIPGGLIDGIIGTGLFSRERVELNFRDGTLRVSQSSDEPGSGTELFARIMGDAKLVTRIDIGGESRVALIDSGASVCGISPKFARKLHPDDSPSEAKLGGAGVGGDGPVGMRLGKPTTATFGGRVFDALPTVEIDALDALLSPVIGVQIRVLVGMPVLRESRSFTIDFGRTKMWIDWGEQQP